MSRKGSAQDLPSLDDADAAGLLDDEEAAAAVAGVGEVDRALEALGEGFEADREGGGVEGRGLGVLGAGEGDERRYGGGQEEGGEQGEAAGKRKRAHRHGPLWSGRPSPPSPLSRARGEGEPKVPPR